MKPLPLDADTVRALLDGATKLCLPLDLCAQQFTAEQIASVRLRQLTDHAPGDVVFVQEGWAHDATSDEVVRASLETLGANCFGPYYKEPPHDDPAAGLTFRPADTMPAWASRLRLRIVDVKVEEHDGKWCAVYSVERVGDD